MKIQNPPAYLLGITCTYLRGGLPDCGLRIASAVARCSLALSLMESRIVLWPNLENEMRNVGGSRSQSSFELISALQDWI